MAASGITWTAGALHETKALIWPRRYRFLLGLLLLLVNRGTGLVQPAALMHFVDGVVSDRRSSALWSIVAVIAIASLIQALTAFLLARILAVTAQQTVAELRRKIQAHVMRLPISFFDSTKSGVIVSRIMVDAEYLRDLIGSGLVHFGGNTLTALGALMYLFHLNARLTMMLLGIVTVFGGAIAWSFHRLRPMYQEGANIRASIFARLSESLSGIRVVKVYTAEKREERIFTASAHRLFRNLATSHMWWSANGALTTIAIGTIGVTITLSAGPGLLTGEVSVGQFMGYVLFVALVFGPVEHVVWMGPHVGEALGALERIHVLLNEKTELEDDHARSGLGPIAGEVRFEDVSFEYDAGFPALSGVSFVVPAGTTIALVGASGAGKSTLISLVMAFVRPTSGRVLVDGRDLTTVRLRDYRSQLGVVLQDNFLFDGTVIENIQYGCPGATDDEVRAASRVAHADEFISRLPLQYDTVVGERGVKLSGGQRQRIAIARAILADPRILVLDEATSSLDSETEALIQDGLHALRRGRTSFVIAHRLSTVRSADMILLLERGCIVERGTHAKLIALGGAYRAFYDRQYAIDSERLLDEGEEVVPDL